MGRKSREKRERRENQQLRELWGYDLPYSPPVAKYPAQPKASSGLNHSERYLASLCRRTFLSTWSYPNIYRAERRGDGSVQSKEVCDLLVVFESDVLLFSDKDIVFPQSDDIHKDWARWYRRAIKKSAAQLYGAERVIRDADQLFLDPALKNPLPLLLPNSSSMRLHRILVAHGASERCRNSLGGNGTLMIKPSLIGDDHVRPIADGGIPFAIGRIEVAKGFIHVLDDSSLHLLLQTLDTARDLIAYLLKKEELLLSGRIGLITGEEGLLGLYLSDIDDTGNHFFRLPPGDSEVNIDESWWHRYRTGREAPSKEAADRVSYLWDAMIERFAKHFRDGTSEHAMTTVEQNRLLQFFAREGRLHRRGLVKTIIDMLENTKPNMRRLRVVEPTTAGDPHWLFLVFPYHKHFSYEQNREARRGFLYACALVTRLVYPGAVDIVGYATESGQGRVSSEDALYFDGRLWTEAMEREARTLQRKFHILLSGNYVSFNEREYPMTGPM